MRAMVVIKMQNPNALISMAMVSQNENNPFSVFCSYLKYCIYSNSTNSITLTDLRESVCSEFGISLPYNILMSCLNKMQQEKSISIKKHEIKRIGFFDTEEFDGKRNEYRQIEKAVVNELISFAADYGRNWTEEYAREQLIMVLDNNGLAYDIFMHKDNIGTNNTPSEKSDQIIALLPDEESDDDATDSTDELIEAEPLYSDSFFVGKFIEKTISAETQERYYLEKICEGLMICVGAYQLPNGGVDQVMPQIQGTSFFFDTKVLLRFLGCAGDSAVAAVKELVELIHSGGGRIYYYPQTLEEINNAFDKAIRSIEAGYPPHNNEMRIFASKHGFSATVFRTKKASVIQELERASILKTSRLDFDEHDRVSFGFSREYLFDFMKRKLPWDQRAIENDAWSIWETHMRRNGNYEDYCGTSRHLQVFVTTNSRLIGVSLAFRDENPQISSIFGWKQNRLPVITDIRLTCRLWSPSKQGSKMSRLYLTANSVAAQRPTQRYINTIRELARQLEESIPEYSAIPLPSYFNDNVTDAILNRTKGDESKLDIGNFASSLQELTEWKARDQEVLTHQAKKERDQYHGKFSEQTTSIIDGAIDANKNTTGGAPRLLLTLISWWIVIAPIIFAGIGAVISLAANSWTLFLGASAIVAVFIISEIIVKRCINKILLTSTLPFIEERIKKNIEKNLRNSELPYKDQIIPVAIEQNEQLQKCKKRLTKATDLD